MRSEDCGALAVPEQQLVEGQGLVHHLGLGQRVGSHEAGTAAEGQGAVDDPAAGLGVSELVDAPIVLHPSDRMLWDVVHPGRAWALDDHGHRVHPKPRVYGTQTAIVIGPAAGDLIHEVCVAMEFGASAEDLAARFAAAPQIALPVKGCGTNAYAA